MKLPAIHEYAGFLYRMSGTPERIMITPVEGQHRATQKEKHLRAALSTFLEEQGKK